jgi:hypothetical protein
MKDMTEVEDMTGVEVMKVMTGMKSDVRDKERRASL